MDSSLKPLESLTAAELRAWARQYRAMAETASPADVVLALRKLAVRYEAMADERESASHS